MRLILTRYFSNEEITLGFLRVEYSQEILCYTLELPWRNNKPSISCVPEGIYDVTFLEKSYSGKFKNCYWITNPPEGRSGILMHCGNTTADTSGCILVGKLAGNNKITRSGVAMRELHKLTDKSNFELVIKNEYSSYPR